jgi:hypothetical protein
MSEKELKTYLSDIKKAADDIAKDKGKSERFLIDIGLLNRKGKVKRQYRKLCIPIDQA